MVSSDEGDAGNYYASVLAGTNFMDDRGNIAVNFEYAKQEAFFASRSRKPEQQGNCRGRRPIVGSVDGSDGIPDRLYFDDIRFASLSNSAVRS